MFDLDNVGCSMTRGCNARHTFPNPYAGAANSVLELASPIASVGGNVSLYNASAEYLTSIKPAPVVSMFGRGELIGWEWPETGDKIAIVETTKEEFGESVLDAISGGNGKAPEVGDINAIPIIHDFVERAALSGCMAVTRGGPLYVLRDVRHSPK